MADIEEISYKDLELNNETEFLNLTCAQIRSKARKLRHKLHYQGETERAIKVDKARKILGDDALSRLEYDTSNFAN